MYWLDLDSHELGNCGCQECVSLASLSPAATEHDENSCDEYLSAWRKLVAK